MPTSEAAASERPTTDTSPRVRHRAGRLSRLAPFALVLPIAASFAATPAPVAGRAGPSCSSWNSLTTPPDSIRVLRVQTGRIETVNFRKYVVTVMGKEWPSYLPQPVVEAGAVAVKQYGWYHAVYSNRSYNGRCFDVKDSTGDQLYKPQRSRVRPDHYRALDATWNVSLRKQGRFFMTGYRRGEKVNCGRDATGYKLFARSATECARKGHGWREILRTYYAPGLDIVGGGGTNDSSTAADPTTTGTPSQPTDTTTQATDTTTQATDTTTQATDTTTQATDTAADSAAVRLSNGRWVDESPARADTAVSSGFGGAAEGGLAADFAAPTVPIGPFERLVVDAFVVV